MMMTMGFAYNKALRAIRWSNDSLRLDSPSEKKSSHSLFCLSGFYKFFPLHLVKFVSIKIIPKLSSLLNSLHVLLIILFLIINGCLSNLWNSCVSHSLVIPIPLSKPFKIIKSILLSIDRFFSQINPHVSTMIP